MPSSAGPDGSPRRAAILLASLSTADATSHDATGIAAALRDRGWDARVFTSSRDAGATAATLSEAARLLDDDDVLWMYHSGGRWDDGMALLEHVRGPIVVRDHNVTPARFFEGVSDEFVDAAIQGERQRARLARDPRVVRFLAASPRNASDLEELGASPTRLHVVPPFHCIDDLVHREPDATALRRWQCSPAATFVGRIAPNKGLLGLLRVARLYFRLFAEPLTLRVVGTTDPRLHPYTGRIDRELDDPALARVEFVGRASPGELKAAYLAASVFLCASEHEGFCVPLVEATAFGVPVVARSEPGVVSTLGGSALISQDEVALAIAVRRIEGDSTLREQLVRRARDRCRAAFSSEALRDALEAGLTGV